MSRTIPLENAPSKPTATSRLELITAMTLWAVILSLAWMVLVAYQPDYFRVFSVEVEIIIILALLLTSLILVSAVALRHTRLP